jgi:hypothetical protein
MPLDVPRLHRRSRGRARSPGRQDGPGATAPRSRRCDLGAARRAAGVPDRSAPCPRAGLAAGRRHRGPAFGDDTAWARAIAAALLAPPELEPHAIVRPGQGGQRPLSVTVDATRRGRAEGTRHPGLDRAHRQGEPGGGRIDITRRKASRGGRRAQTGQDGRGWWRDEGRLLLLCRRSLRQRRGCGPTASDGLRMALGERDTGASRRMPRDFRVSYHQKRA